eukprot:2200556-Amphidinium_carterae.1
MADFPPLTPEERASLAYGTHCCQCNKQLTDNEGSVVGTQQFNNCWFNEDGKCRHVCCEEHGKHVGYYKPGGCAIYWCACHDTVCLPAESDPWDNVHPDSDGFVDDGSSDTEWDIRERLRREHMAFRRDEVPPTSTSSEAAPRQPQSPRTRIGTLLQVMQVMQDMGLKILSLHEKDRSSGSQVVDGAGTSSATSDIPETGYEPPYPPTTDPVLRQIYDNDALSRVQKAPSLDDTIAQMEEEHRAFHEVLEQATQRSAAAKAKATAKSEPTPTFISQLPRERAEQVVEKYVTEASDRLAILMKLNGTVPEVNLLAHVPMGDVDHARPNAKVRVRRTTRKQQRRFAEAKSKTKAALQAEYYADLRVLETMIQQIKAESP